MALSVLYPMTRAPPLCSDASNAGMPRTPSDVIVLAIRWYLRSALSYRDVEDLLANADFHAGCSAQPSAVITRRAAGPSMPRPGTARQAWAVLARGIMVVSSC